MNQPADERGVFTYQAGGQPFRADPLELHLRLTAALGNGANHVLKEARNTEEPGTAAQARLRLIDSVRAAFGLPPYDPDSGQGCTAAACERVLGEYLAFCGAEKKNTAPTPTSPTPSPDTDHFSPTSAYDSASS